MIEESEKERLVYIISNYLPAKKAFREIRTFMLSKGSKHKWRNVSNSVSKILADSTGIECNIFFRSNKTFSLYDIVVHGAATVPDEDNFERDLDIYIDMSKELYNKKMILEDVFFEEFEKLFMLTFLHELTHTTQFDTDITYDNSTKLKYLMNPLELDAYSTELACNMKLYNEKRSYCESYSRYNSLKDRNIFKEFINLSLMKFEYLKTINI